MDGRQRVKAKPGRGRIDGGGSLLDWYLRGHSSFEQQEVSQGGINKAEDEKIEIV